MKYIILTIILLSGCTLVSAGNEVSVTHQQSSDENVKVIKHNHIEITITNTKTCIATIELPKNTPLDIYVKIVSQKRAECFQVEQQATTTKRSRKYLINL